MKLESYHYVAIGAAVVALLWIAYEFWPAEKHEQKSTIFDPEYREWIAKLWKVLSEKRASKPGGGERYKKASDEFMEVWTPFVQYINS